MRRMVRAATLLALIVTAAAAPAPAGAATHGLSIGPWHRIAEPGTPTVLTDGSRYVVTLFNKRGIDVHDSLRNRDRAIARPPCTYPGGQPDRQPRFVLGSGLVAWQCTYPQRAAIWVDDIRRGTRTPAGGLAGVWQNEIGTADGGTFTLASVGRHWVYLIRDGYHYTDDILAGLHDARFVVRPAARADETVDPDAPSGVVRLCAGIRRPEGSPERGELPFLPLQFEAPYGALTRDSRTSRARWVGCDTARARTPRRASGGTCSSAGASSPGDDQTVPTCNRRSPGRAPADTYRAASSRPRIRATPSTSRSRHSASRTPRAAITARASPDRRRPTLHGHGEAPRRCAGVVPQARGAGPRALA